MFPCQSHRLAPLTALTGKGNYHQSNMQQQGFDVIKAMMIQDCLLRYPDHNKPFDIYTDASDYQLTTRRRDYARQCSCHVLLAQAQQFSTMEKELLSIYETIKEFCSMLLGAQNTVHTDHKTLLIQPQQINE
jgi:hypothetical protein